jgi:hypothetical protein
MTYVVSLLEKNVTLVKILGKLRVTELEIN